jgi:hypothetical protein
MKWLRDVHLKGLSEVYKSAVVHGNEDSPSRIDVYMRRDPNFGEVSVAFIPSQRGEFSV